MFVSYSVYQWYDERKYAIKNNEYPTVKKKIMNQCQTISIKIFFLFYCQYLNDGCHNKLHFYSIQMLFNSLLPLWPFITLSFIPMIGYQ